MQIETLVVSIFATNCYLVGCPETGEGIVVDPGAGGRRILEAIERERVEHKGHR
ncbi:MAG: hypothetical protein ACOX30_01095 [Dethiobacteria bacterium]